MGVDTSATVYWGVWEPKEWIVTRRDESSVLKAHRCEKGHAESGKYCSKCGGKLEPVYGSAPLFPYPEGIEGYGHEFVHNTTAYSKSPWMFGIAVERVDPEREEQGKRFTEPSQEEKMRLADFLVEIGYRVGFEGPAPGFWLVPEAH